MSAPEPTRSPPPAGSTAAFSQDQSPTATPLPVFSSDRYRVGDEIARGGMGVVYRATDTALGREVAIKVLHHRFGPDSGPARRFAEEARITAQLQHPAIPPVHDFGSLADGRPPFVADSAEATRQLAARGKMDECFARLDAITADPELVALAKRCLAPEKGGRPADAGQVAHAIFDMRVAGEERAWRAEVAQVRYNERWKWRMVLAVALFALAFSSCCGYRVMFIDEIIHPRTGR
jgi:hypothetical protein